VNKAKIKSLKSVTILGRKYKIKQKECPTLNNQRVAGYADPMNMIICMEKNLNDHDYVNVLCHEICHCIFFTFGGDQVMSNMEIEIFCQSFGSGFSDFIVGSILK